MSAQQQMACRRHLLTNLKHPEGELTTPTTQSHTNGVGGKKNDDPRPRLGGRMFIPVKEPGGQFIWLVDKDEAGRVTKEKQYGVLYVPLTDARNYGGEHGMDS